MIYFIEEQSQERWIKIGMATDPIVRLASLRTANPRPLSLLAVADGAKEREAEEHKRWSHLRGHGEWFRPDPALLEHIEDLNWVSGDCADCGDEAMYWLVVGDELNFYEPLCEDCEKKEVTGT